MPARAPVPRAARVPCDLDPRSDASRRQRLTALRAEPVGRLARALLLLGDRATLLILRNAFLLGTRRFGDWREQLGLSESVLADRLALLVAAGILAPVQYSTAPPRHEYRLADQGLDLWRLLVAQVEWERSWSPVGAPQPRLRHLKCETRIAPRLICGRDREPLSARETNVEVSDLSVAAGAVPPRVRRRSVQLDPARPELALDATLTVIGDRWSAVLIGLALIGVRRFVDFQRAMGAGPNVVSDRVRRLCKSGVLAPEVPEGAKRAQYRLTDRGRELFPFYVLLVAWADRWLVDQGPRLMIIRHGRHVLDPQLACPACGERLTRRSVRYERQD